MAHPNTVNDTPSTSSARPVSVPKPHHPRGLTRDQRGVADRDVIVAVFKTTGSINQAAKRVESRIRWRADLLVVEGLVTSDKIPPKGKFEARRRCLALLAAGWSTARAAREVGVNVRTARDWRKGIRHVSNTRIYPDGRVVDYNYATVYKHSVTSVACDDTAWPAIDSRYLSIEERVAIADGLLGKESLRAIAGRIGKPSPPSRGRSASAAWMADICRIRPIGPRQRPDRGPSSPNWW